MTLESERMKERLRNEATLMEGDEGAPTFTSDLRWLLDQLEQAEQRERGLREALERTLTIHAYSLGSSRRCDCSSCANAVRLIAAQSEGSDA